MNPLRLSLSIAVCERWSRAASIRRRGAGFAFGDVPSFGLLMPNERA
jgi:hypothetical protein